MNRTVIQQVWRGFLPQADSLDQDSIPEFYRSYLRTDIERDIRLIADVVDWQEFGRFVQLTTSTGPRKTFTNGQQAGRLII
ncbi:MAG: hypothetical protein M0Z50_17275 [Planctomycetia bacterium]|nr:hypothetical protein [Planctomycetia bacterium]